MIICYTVSEIWRMTDVIVIFNFGLFFALLPPKNPKNENFKKINTTPGHIISLHICTTNYDHMMYCSWDMVCDRQTDRWTDRRTDGWTDGQTDGQMDDQMDGWKKWHIKVSAPPKNFFCVSCSFQYKLCSCPQ